MDFKVNDEPLEEKLEKVERARSWSPRVIPKLENSIRREEGGAEWRRMMRFMV